jgi:PAS domain S-box-containing protein
MNGATVEPSDRKIEELAYAIWDSKGRSAGGELDDWLTAQAELIGGGSLPWELEGTSTAANRQLLAAILAHATAVISVKDTRGRYLLVNSRFELLFNVPWERVEGKTDHDLFPAGQADASRANDLRVIAEGRAIEFDEVVREGDGEHDYSSLKFPIPGRDGSVYAVCCLATDVTESRWGHRCLTAQHAVARALAESAAAADVGSAVLRAVCESLGWDVGLLWRVDPTLRLLRCTEVWHTPATAVHEFERVSRGLLLPPGIGLPGRVWAAAEPVWIPNVVVAEDLPRSDAALKEGLHAACGFPVSRGGEVAGVIEFFSREIRAPDPDLLRVMEGITSQVGQFAERRQAEQTLLERAREFHVARSVQLGLLPKVAPSVPGVAIGGTSLPAQETGGDYFDFIPMRDGTLGIVIGDASGHGIGAALVIAQTRAYLRARSVTDTDIGAILALLNRQLAGDLPDDHFVTLFFGRLDASTNSLTFSSAGHWPGYVLDDRGMVRVELNSTGLPLGVDAAAVFPAAPPIALRAGDHVLLLTDGILEAHPPDGGMFGIERTLDVVRKQLGGTADEVIAALVGAAQAFSRNTQTDDMTAVLLKVGG